MEEVKERKCIICGKTLLDEKLPICLRCRLEGRNLVGKGSALLFFIGGTAAGGKKLIEQKQDNHKI